MNDEDNMQESAVPVVEEELVTGTRRVKTGSVRIRKKVERLNRTVDIPTVRDAVDVTRRVVNQVVTTAPQVREEGDTLIIPVLEEEIVVTKRLVLKEEIHITRRQVESTVSRDVTLGREVATVERLDAQGRPLDTPDTAEAAALQPRVETPTVVRSETASLIPADPIPASRPRKGLLD